MWTIINSFGARQCKWYFKSQASAMEYASIHLKAQYNADSLIYQQYEFNDAF